MFSALAALTGLLHVFLLHDLLLLGNMMASMHLKSACPETHLYLINSNCFAADFPLQMRKLQIRPHSQHKAMENSALRLYASYRDSGPQQCVSLPSLYREINIYSTPSRITLHPTANFASVKILCVCSVSVFQRL